MAKDNRGYGLGHNHHNDNYVGKCDYGREGEREERDGTRFLCRPAVSFDLSLIIVVSIELIAILAVLLARLVRLFDRFCFFNPLLHLLSLSHINASPTTSR